MEYAVLKAVREPGEPVLVPPNPVLFGPPLIVTVTTKSLREDIVPPLKVTRMVSPAEIVPVARDVNWIFPARPVCAFTAISFTVEVVTKGTLAKLAVAAIVINPSAIIRTLTNFIDDSPIGLDCWYCTRKSTLIGTLGTKD